MRRLANWSAVLCLIVARALPVQAQSPAAVGSSTAEAGVRAVVNEFGRRLREISVLASKDTAAAAMDQVYAPYVATELLTAWKTEPETAPGKRTSSPSPERIDIAEVRPRGSEAFIVTGNVILLTAKERRDGGIFAANPVTLGLTKRGSRWLITAYTETEASP